MTLPFVLIALACALFLAGGYIVGARRAVDARDALRSDLAAARADATLHDQHRRELDGLRNRLSVAEADLAAAHAEQRRADLASAQAQGELRHQLALATRRNDAAAAALREAERALTPLLERERVAQAIEDVGLGGGTRGELPRLLDAIARAGRLRALVLSDDAGLPLAASEGAERAEVLAAVWSQVLAVGDRVAANGEPPPVSLRVLDAHGRVLVQRVLTAGPRRFLLVAVAHGEGAAPDVLEPAVPKLEQVLVRDAWQE